MDDKVGSYLVWVVIRVISFCLFSWPMSLVYVPFFYKCTPVITIDSLK